MREEREISFFYDFHTPPYGGGNQFLLALKQEFQRCGVGVRVNEITGKTLACLFNSYNLDFSTLERTLKKHPSCRVIHRVDGPISLYRGTDDGTDSAIFTWNAKLADVTIFQSCWSLKESLQAEFRPKHPVVIHNAVDASIFHSRCRIEFSSQRKIRLISTSWSDNPRKGAPFYEWLEEHLDWDRFDYTFVGRSPVRFKQIRQVDPQPSHGLANLLRQHDIYITASEKDPCSNALIEALACGLPAVYLNDGGHPELAGNGGRPFTGREDILKTIDDVINEYALCTAHIAVTPIETTARKYLEVMCGNEQRAGS